ncbi:TPA: glycosyltransferase, partial [Candidatus Micrarchaeota archaeon]|nr:glycosyltransferase [Candidatus Micrarchaeota archaeon]
MRITVVIPTLNEEENLNCLLQMLANQTLKDFEVIVVDGGSSDGTVQVARDFGAQVITVKE